MMIKIVQVIFCLTQVYSITVPPVWPDASYKKHSYTNRPTSRPFYQESFKPITPATPVITHGSFKIPSFFPEDTRVNTHSTEQFGRFGKLNKFREFDAIEKSANKDELHFRPSVNQNVYIKHPTPQTNSPAYRKHDTNSPQSFQIVHFDNQNPTIVPQNTRIVAQNIYRQPHTYRSKQQNTQRPATKQHTIPFVRQHLTEVTAQPTEYANKQIHPLTARQNYQNEGDSNENLEEEENEDDHLSDVPTKPIYPGEGQWAKYGIKHRPYIRDQSEPIKLQETQEDERPEGYETFERGEEQFRIAQNKFKHNLATFPQRHQLKDSPAETRSSLGREPLYEKPEIDFVPQKLYTQVRKTESQKHLPRSEIDPEQEENADRLREVIKDSIVHTVYSEEGYEDSAYDHAGHEKKAQNSEGHSENSGSAEKSSERGRGGGRSGYSDESGRRYGKNSSRGNIRHNDRSKSENFADTKSYEKIKKHVENDAEEAGSDYDSKKVAAKIPSKEVKNVVLKNKDQKEINMEILTEIKYTPQLKRHKYVRIAPSTIRSKNNTEKISTSTTTSTTTTPRPRTLRAHKRIKRYDKDILSKRYVRKRPNYYWKRIKITSNGTDRLSKKYESSIKPSKLIPKLLTTSSSEEIMPEKTTKSPQRSTTTPKVSTSSTTTTSIPTATTVYSITVPPTKKAGIVTTTTSNPNSAIPSKSSISPPKLVEELHPDLMNPELTTKSSKRLPPKVPPVKIKKFVKKRPKRYTIDHPDIEVDLKGFINVAELEEPTEKPDLTHIKYPYYTLPITETLSENSPLRYAEDLDNIPVKMEDQMTFYNSKSHIRCPEIPSNVNPIPDRVQNQEEGEETDKMAETPDFPRLKGLGDKIDCLKEKYWGENPLDSPFFGEEVVETPIPLFMIKNGLKSKEVKMTTEKETNKIAPSKKPMYHKTRNYGKENQNSQKYNLFNVRNGVENNAKKRELKIKILEPIVVIDDEFYDAATMNPIHQSNEAVLKPPYTLEEMMTMNEEKLAFPPKSIYDKITLLEQNTTTEKSITTKLSTHRPALREKFLIVYENQESVPIKQIQPDKKKASKKVKTYNENKTEKFQIDTISNLTSLTYNDPKMNASSNIQPQIPLKYFIRTSSPKPPPIYTRKLAEKTIKKPISNNRKLAIKIQPNISSTSTTFAPTIQTTTHYAIPEIPAISTYKPVDHFPEAAAIMSFTKPPITQAQIRTTPRPIKQNPKPTKNPSVISPNTQPSWSELSTHLSSLYNVFDITQYLPKIPNHRIVTSEVQYKEEIKPSDQMKVYNDVLKTIKEAKSATVLKPVVDGKFTKNDQKLIASTSAPIQPKPIANQHINIQPTLQENRSLNTETIPQSSHQIAELLSAPESIPYQKLYQYYNKYISNPVPEEIQVAQPSQNIYYVIGLQEPRLGYRQKRDVSSKSKTKDVGSNEDMMMEESKYSINVGKIGAENHIRKKRQVFYQENSPEDDLLMEETEYRPAYSSPPERKPKIYTEIIRSRPARPQVEIEDEEEEEDLNPRKRIYELKSSKSTTESSPEYEDDYVEEIIEQPKSTTTTKKPRVFPVEANQKDPTIAQYLFLIDKAHAVWAAEDATSTTTAPETEAPKTIITQTVAESVNVRRGEPTYLQLINQLHEVRKEIDDKTSPAPTTVPSTTEEVFSSVPVRNSNPFLADSGFSDTFLSELKSMQDKLDNDNTAEGSTVPEVSSRTRNFDTKFRTSIDTSKYKTIERAPINLRHNFSSRFSAQDQLPLSKTQTTQEPTIIAIITKPQESYSSTTEAGESFNEADILAKVLTDTILPETFHKPPEPEVSSTESTITSTIRSRGRVRGRARPTTSTTARPQTSTLNPVFRRRRPTIRGSTTTTTTISPVITNPSIRRRSRLKASETRGFVPEVRSKVQNPTAEESTSEAVVVVTPVPVLNHHQTTEEPKNKRKFQKVQERRVTSEVTLTRYFEPESAESESNADDDVSGESEELEESKKHQYEIIGPLTHTDTKHGGNYRYEHEEDRIADVVHPPESFFNDPHLAVDVNHLKENSQTETSSPKTQASNSVHSTDEIEEKVLHQRRKPALSKVSLYPNMARMINRLAESRPEQVVHAHPSGKQDPAPEEGRQAPAFIKDPSRRMYYYAKL